MSNILFGLCVALVIGLVIFVGDKLWSLISNLPEMYYRHKERMASIRKAEAEAEAEEQRAINEQLYGQLKQKQ